MSDENTNSLTHQEYLKRQARKRRNIRLAQWGLLIAFIALWEIAAQLKWINPFIMSSPMRMMKTITSLVKSGELYIHLFVTLWETVVGFILATIFGVLISVALWWSKFASRVLEPYLVVINSLPKIALGPVFIVWLGAGQAPIIAVAVLVSIIITIMTVLEGFASTSPDKITLLRAFGANKSQVFMKVVLPSNLPVIVSALKINVGMAWVGVIVGEFLVSRAGLGYLIVYGGQVLKMDLVMASTAILCILAALMYAGVALIEKRLKRDRR